MTRTAIATLTACAAALSLAACNTPAEPAAAPGGAPEPAAAAPADPAAAPAGTLPADGAAQQEKFEICEHFASEEPYDDARRDQINAAIETNCRPVKEALPTLKAKYADDPAVMALVKDWEELLGAFG